MGENTTKTTKPNKTTQIKTTKTETKHVTNK